MHLSWLESLLDAFRQWCADEIAPISLVSAVATVVACWLAWWAVRQSKKAAQDAREGLARERRSAFELGVLARMAELLALRSEAGTADALRGLLLMLQPEDLVTLHRFLKTYDGSTMPNDKFPEYADVQSELKEAVERRMVEVPF